MLRIVIGLVNYNGVACGLNFEKSVAQNVPEDWDREHVQIRRLLALFPGTTAEDVKASPTIGEDDDKIKQELEAARAADEAARKAAEEIEEVVEEDIEEDESAEVPLRAGDQVLAHYKGEYRRGEVVQVLESGIVYVNIDGDDANYRVLDDDKVTRLDTNAAE